MQKINLLTFITWCLLCSLMLGTTACQTGSVVAVPPTETATWPALPSPTDTVMPPTAVVEASPTATATPSPIVPPTPFPTPTVTPLPEEGYYGNPAIGFGFYYPSEWEAEEFNSGISIKNEALGLVVFGQSNLLDVDQPLGEVITDYYQLVGDENTVVVISDTTTLWDGTEAQVFNLKATDNLAQARLTMVTKGRRLYSVVVAGRGSAFENYPQTIEAIAASMEISEPRPYDLDLSKTISLAWGQPTTIDPAKTEGSAGGVTGAVFSGLVMLDETLQVIPDLAERWEISEDGTVYTFYLRDGIVFHDGKAITAEDVKFSWERATDSATESKTAETYLADIVGVKEKLAGEAESISGVEVIDTQTLQVTIDAPKAYFLAKLTYPTSFVVDSTNVTADDSWEDTPNGSGPFRLMRWEDDQVMILRRYENYFPEPAKVEYILLRLYPDVPIWMYENDEIDWAGVGTDSIERVTDPDNPLHEELYNYANLCTNRIALDPTLPPLDDPLVRQALAMAIDRESINELNNKGTSQLANSIFPPGMPGYNDEVTTLSFDPKKAKELLAQSSYGEALPELKLTVSGEGNELSDFESALLEMWRTHLGIDVGIDNIDPEAYTTLVRENHYQMRISGWCADYPDPENFLDVLYHSESGFNWSGYSNSDVDSLLEQARVEQDVAKRLDLYHQAELLIMADTPDILMFHGQSQILVKPYIKNFYFSPLGGQSLTWRIVSLDKAID